MVVVLLILKDYEYENENDDTVRKRKWLRHKFYFSGDNYKDNEDDDENDDEEEKGLYWYGSGVTNKNDE